MYGLVLINIKYGSLISGPENETFKKNKNIKTLGCIPTLNSLINDVRWLSNNHLLHLCG
jgi:hypothetical protein